MEYDNDIKVQYLKCIICCYRANSFNSSIKTIYKVKWSVHAAKLLCLMYIGFEDYCIEKSSSYYAVFWFSLYMIGKIKHKE